MGCCRRGEKRKKNLVKGEGEAGGSSEAEQGQMLRAIGEEAVGEEEVRELGRS
jgi:hypothetical protein